MKIVLSQVLKFPIFFDTISKEKLPIKTLYKIFQLKQKTEETINFYQENLQKIIEECALRDESGQLKKDAENGVLISKDKIEDCMQRMEELNNFLIDFPEIYFGLEEFSDIKITLEQLEPIFLLIINN